MLFFDELDAVLTEQVYPLAAANQLQAIGYVFGVDRDTPDLMVQLTERYASSLARHRHDQQV